MIRTRQSPLDSWHQRIPYGQSVEFWLGEFWKYLLTSLLASCRTFRQKLKIVEKDNQRLQWKTPSIQALFYPLSSSWNWVYFQKVDSTMQNVRRSSDIARKCISKKKQKKWPAALQRKPLFHRKNLPKRSWHSRTRLKLIFLEEDCSFLSLKYCIWEVGKERRKLTLMGPTRCLAQSLHRLLLPSELHYLLKVWGVFSLDSTADVTPPPPPPPPPPLNRIRESPFPWDCQAESERERPEFSIFKMSLEFLLIEASTQTSNA